jgi:hypothetical protein
MPLQQQIPLRLPQALQLTMLNRRKIPHPPLRTYKMSKLCEKIAGLQTQAKAQAKEVSEKLDEGRDPTHLITALRDQVETVKTLQKCVTDLGETKEGLTGPVLNQLRQTFKELAGLTEQNHKNATKKGIKLTPKVHR